MDLSETVLTAATLALLHVNLCIAQAGDSRDFYENNYAKTTADLDTRGAQTVAGAKERRQKAKTSSGSVSEGKKGSQLDRDKGGSQTKKRRIIVSVVVNSRDRLHFAKVLEEVFRLSDTKLAFVSEIVHIGDYTTVTDNVEKECAKRGILIRQIDSPPKDLSVSTSPAWRVQTRDGFYVVEGFLSLGRFIDGWGEFNPKSHQSVETDLRIEGF